MTREELVAKAGYDGNAPEFRLKRGSEVRDHTTGAVIRDGEMGAVNVCVDRLEWLLAHKRIEPHQHTAGEYLQADWQLAEQLTFATAGAARSGGGTNRLADAKCDAHDRMNDAVERLGGNRSIGWKIVDLVILQNVSLEKAERSLALPLRSGLGALRGALDSLARLYGLA